jgi:hypothetical protein
VRSVGGIEFWGEIEGGSVGGGGIPSCLLLGGPVWLRVIINVGGMLFIIG